MPKQTLVGCQNEHNKRNVNRENPNSQKQLKILMEQVLITVNCLVKMFLTFNQETKMLVALETIMDFFYFLIVGIIIFYHVRFHFSLVGIQAFFQFIITAITIFTNMN